MEIIVNDNTFSVKTEAGRTVLESGEYSSSSNAYRGARKARMALLNSRVKQYEGTLTVESKQGHVLASQYFSTNGNRNRAYNSLIPQLQQVRELANPLPISSMN